MTYLHTAPQCTSKHMLILEFPWVWTYTMCIQASDWVYMPYTLHTNAILVLCGSTSMWWCTYTEFVTFDVDKLETRFKYLCAATPVNNTHMPSSLHSVNFLYWHCTSNTTIDIWTIYIHISSYTTAAHSCKAVCEYCKWLLVTAGDWVLTWYILVIHTIQVYKHIKT